MNISVCMVVFNEEEFIEGAINSILSNITIGDELVVIEGGSTDRTLEIISQFQDKPNFKLFHFQQNWKKREWADEAIYRDAAWRTCSNNWILSHDADEAFHKKFYENAKYLIENNPNKKAFYFNTINFFGSTRRMIDPEEFPDYHIRLADKRFFSWVGKIHSSLWLNGKESIDYLHPIAMRIPFNLYHYARVKGEVNRVYGEVPQKLIDFRGTHPRKEFDDKINIDSIEPSKGLKDGL